MIDNIAQEEGNTCSLSAELLQGCEGGAYRSIASLKDEPVDLQMGSIVQHGQHAHHVLTIKHNSVLDLGTKRHTLPDLQTLTFRRMAQKVLTRSNQDGVNVCF